MKILLVNKFHYRRGGSETYYFSLAKALEAAGNEVIFFAMESDKNEPCRQGKYFVKNIDYAGKNNVLKQVKMGICSIYSFEAKRKIERLICDEKPDIVHMNLVHRQITLSIVDVCEKYRIPVVFTAHDLVCCCPVGSLTTPLYQTCRKCYEGHYTQCIKNKCIKGSRAKSIVACIEAFFYKKHKSYNKIDVFITPSEFYRNEILKSKITENKVVHMANLLPLDTNYQYFTNKKKYFLFLGALTKNKGVFTLLQAFHKANVEGWKLVFAGSGPEAGKLKQYIIKNHLENRVELLGFISGKELQRVTGDAYAVILPSEWFENGPYALMESMAYGKPVIGANIGGIPEIVIPGKTGWLFESGNIKQLSEILRKVTQLSDAQYRELSQNVCLFAKEKFNANTYVNKLTEIYRELIRRNENESI